MALTDVDHRAAGTVVPNALEQIVAQPLPAEILQGVLQGRDQKRALLEN
jgi:hypothetical protein